MNMKKAKCFTPVCTVASRSKEITDEFKKHSRELVGEFMELFPHNKKFRIIIIKGRSVGATTMAQNELGSGYWGDRTMEDIDNFWYDWYRFQNLKAFL